MFPEVLTGESRRTATQLVRRLGDRLAKEGYRGFFEVDVLVDTDTGEVYLGELNPRISGASSITNVTAGAYADVPLFLFHILEYMNVDFDLDVDEINERWEELAVGRRVEPDGHEGDRRHRAAAHRHTAHRAVFARRAAARWCSVGRRWTGISCRTKRRRSSCASTVPVTTAGRAPTSACWSPRAGCRSTRHG